MSDVVNLWAPNFDTADSYGRIACELAFHLTALGQHVNAMGRRLDYPNQSEALKSILNGVIKPATGGLLLAYPTNFEKLYGALATSGPMVAITMFESTKLPDGWSEVLNRMNAVIVPSKWCRDIFRANGVKAPMHVIPLGVSETYHPVERPLNRKPFTFLAIGDRWRRKGWDLALLAFNQAFGTNPDYRLVIKARTGGLQAFDIKHPCVEVIRQDMTEHEMQALFERTDALIAPTHGEGFYLFPLEYMRTGAPAIVTNWSGPADYIHLCYPLRYKLVDAWPDNDKLRGLGQWAEPDIDHMVEQMTYVATGDQRGIRWMSMHNARRIRQRYTWRGFAEGVLKVWLQATRPVVSDSRKRRKAKARQPNGH
jgi:glycosyltransferase involved in cell wall biosynthesis